MTFLEHIEHLEWMIGNLPEASDISLEQGKHDRWVGFMQGALWAMNLATIDDFRESVREGRSEEDLLTLLSDIRQSILEGNEDY